MKDLIDKYNSLKAETWELYKQLQTVEDGFKYVTVTNSYGSTSKQHKDALASIGVLILLNWTTGSDYVMSIMVITDTVMFTQIIQIIILLLKVLLL